MGIRRHAAAMAAILALQGCAEEAPPPAPAPDLSHLQETGCYTVDLFDEPEIAPAPAQIAPDRAAWLGHWGGGVWNGTWCHEMVVTRIDPTGLATLLDMHAPSEQYGQPATVFRRKARFFEDGSLRFVHGTVVRRYVMRDGRLVGTRQGDGFGRMEVVLTRPEVDGPDLAQN